MNQSNDNTSKTQTSSRTFTPRRTAHSGTHVTTKSENVLTPFYLRWCYGKNTKIPASNLTTSTRKLIFYAAAHAGILYDYENRDMRLLLGHKNPVTHISTDEQGRWVVTSDCGEDNVVIIWDTISCTPINTLFSPHGDYGVQLVGFSKNSKYLITIGNEPKSIIKFWLWTYGKDEPDAEYEVEDDVGLAKNTRFNTNFSEHFVMTFDNVVLFGSWDENEMHVHRPEQQAKGKGQYTASTYITRSHNAVTATALGYVIVWGDTIYECSFDECKPIKNNKEFIKAIKLSDHCINVIKDSDGIVVTGDAAGKIRFYDSELKILYWIQKYKFDCIKSISFNPGTKTLHTMNTTDSEISTIKSQSSDNISKHSKIITTPNTYDATLERKPFCVRDFLVVTLKGTTAIYKFSEDTVEYILSKNENYIEAMTTHNEKNILLFGNSFGRLIAFNITFHTIVAEYLLPEIKIDSDDMECSTRPRTITCLRYSLGGFHLACGLHDGSVWMLDPSTLYPKTDEPFSAGSYPIKDICFSHNSLYMAHYDTAHRVFLYKFNDDQEWYFIGKIKSHYKPITQMLFSEASDKFPILYTFGEDRKLVEYDIEQSIKLEKIIIKSCNRVEQSAIPLCAVWNPLKQWSKLPSFIASDNQFKYKCYAADTSMTLVTMLGPTFGQQPIKFMIIVPEHASGIIDNRYLVFGCKNQIGLQKLPPDGNPYRYVGMIGNPGELINLCISADGKYIFTLGKEETCIFQWFINFRAVEVMTKIGGNNLEPFYCLIDGDKHGWLFNEMKDLFYYMQILHQGEITSKSREVSNKIHVYQLPDYMRSIGFYPSDYEVENMLVEVKYHSKNYIDDEQAEIDFESVVKLFINHKPVTEITLKQLHDAFFYFVPYDLLADFPNESISRSELLQILCYNGESIEMKTIRKYLKILLHCQDDTDDKAIETIGITLMEDNFLFVPNTITYNTFLSDILGIETNRNRRDSRSSRLSIWDMKVSPATIADDIDFERDTADIMQIIKSPDKI